MVTVAYLGNYLVIQELMDIAKYIEKSSTKYEGFLTKILEAHTNEKNDRQGTNPLLNACLNGHIESVKILLENGANPKATWKSDPKVNCLALSYRYINLLKLFQERNIFKKEEWGELYEDTKKEANRGPSERQCIEFIRLQSI